MHWFLGALVLAVIAAAGAGFFALLMVKAQTPRRERLRLGLEDGRLPPCPHVANCVCTFTHEDDATHHVDPIPYTGSREKLLEGLEHFVTSGLGGVIVTRDRERAYLHAELTSTILRFVEDLELYAPETGRFLHLRSASRIGYTDLGTNRRRYARIRDFVESSGL